MPLYLPSSSSGGGSSSTQFRLSGDAGQTAAPGSTSEIILPGCQHLMPAGLLTTGREFLVRIMGEKTGATGTPTVTGTVRLRVGTTGLASDAALSNSVQINLAADTRTFGYQTYLRVMPSATAVRRHGPGGVGTPNGLAGQSTNARPSADTIPNVSNALYWTLTCQMAAGTPEWVAISQFEIVLI